MNGLDKSILGLLLATALLGGGGMRTGMREAGRRGPAVVAAVAAAMVLAGSAIPATAITSESCFAQRLKAWGNLRKCQRQEEAKAIPGRSAF